MLEFCVNLHLFVVVYVSPQSNFVSFPEKTNLAEGVICTLYKSTDCCSSCSNLDDKDVGMTGSLASQVLAF